MPYRLDATRMKRCRSLFVETDYTVSALPSYAIAQASNPFDSFRELPVTSRYQFMLDEAQYTIMGFIKGPLCRGQVAVDVIEDQPLSERAAAYAKEKGITPRSDATN